MLIEVLLILIITLLCGMLIYYSLYTKQRALLQKLDNDYRSMYVKHGKHWEHFAPFMDHFPGNKENFRFLGTPIDGIIFDEHEIKFIEIKTGKSGLSTKQQQVKKLVEDKKVSWKELRY